MNRRGRGHSSGQERPFGRGLHIAIGIAIAIGIGIGIGIGIALIFWGLVIGSAGYILVVVGLLPLASGVPNIRLLAPLLKAPFRGRDLAG